MSRAGYSSPPQTSDGAEFLLAKAVEALQNINAAGGLTLASQAEVDAGTNTTAAVSPSTLANVVTGKIIYVDAVTGTDTRTGLSKYSILKPFATMGAANTASASGDLVWVRTGTYTVSAMIVPPTGVNWWFDKGADVSWATVTTNNGIFGDNNTALAFGVFGYGTFSIGTANANSNLVETIGALNVRHASSVISFECDTVTKDGNGLGSTIAHQDGTVTVRARKISNTQTLYAYGYAWKNGRGFVYATESIDTPNTTQPASGAIWINNSTAADLYVECDRIDRINVTTANSASALWINTKTQHKGLTMATGRVYLTCQKIFGGFSSGGGLLYVAADKIQAEDNSPIIDCTNADVFVSIKHWDPNAQTVTSSIIIRGTTILRLIGGEFIASANLGGISIEDDGEGSGPFTGSLRLEQFRLDVSANAGESCINDIDAEGVLTTGKIYLNSSVLVTNGTTACVSTDDEIQVVVYNSYSNNNVGAGVTQQVGTVTVNSNVK